MRTATILRAIAALQAADTIIGAFSAGNVDAYDLGKIKAECWISAMYLRTELETAVPEISTENTAIAERGKG